MRQIINLTQTTSGSLPFALQPGHLPAELGPAGQRGLAQVVRLADYARGEINRIGGYYAFSKELINGDSVFDFDRTKLSVNTLNVGLAGIEVYDLLRDQYDIQIEFGDLGNFLAYLSIGDRPREVERLVSALSEVRRRFGRPDAAGLMRQEYIEPEVVLSPQDAFYAEKHSLPLRSPPATCAASLSCATRRASPFGPGRAHHPGDCPVHPERQGEGLFH